MIEYLVNIEIKRKWNEYFMAQFEVLYRSLYGGTEENGGRTRLRLSMFPPSIEPRIYLITTAGAAKVTENFVVRRTLRLKAQEETVHWR